MMSLVLPAEEAWPTNASAVLFIDIYDWDKIVLDSGAENILERRLSLCTFPYPCSLSINGMNMGVMKRIGEGSLSCLLSNGCSSLSIYGLLLRCDSIISVYSALEVSGALLEITTSSLLSCSSQEDGGAIHAYGSGTEIRLVSSQIQGSLSLGYGGAISMFGGTLEAVNSTFSNCSSLNGGGAIWATQFQCYGSSIVDKVGVHILQSRFEACSTDGNGGAIAVSSHGVVANVSHSRFHSCTCKYSGGGLFVGDTAAAFVTDSYFFRCMAGGAGGGALCASNAILSIANQTSGQNTADSGGGGLLYWEGNISPELMQYGSVSLNPINKAFCGFNNSALYGSCLASSYKSLQVSIPCNYSCPLYPGLPLSITVMKTDWYNQTIASDWSSNIKVFSAASNDVVISGTTIAEVAAGVASFSVSFKPVFLRNTSIGLIPLVLKNEPRFYFSGIDAQTNGLMQSEIVTAGFVNMKAACPTGFVLLLESQMILGGGQYGSCTECSMGTYSVDPIIGITPYTPSCLNCPAGGTCEGGDRVTFLVGTWIIAGGMYRLIACPPGHQLLRTVAGVFSHDAQQCLKCNSDEYIVDSNNSNFTCQQCPQGAICNGNILTGAINGSVWTVDERSGLYVLTSCPPGYQLSISSQDAQQCEPCPALSFCIGGTSSATACPPETFAPQGSTSLTSCILVVYVDVILTLPLSSASFATHQQQSFVEALADTCAVLPSRILIWSITATRRSGSAGVDVQVISKIATSNTAAAASVLALIEPAILNMQLARQGLPPATLQSATVENIAISSNQGVSLAILVAVSVVAALSLVFALAAWYNLFGKIETEEEKRMKEKIRLVRTAFKVTVSHGYALNSDKIPFWRQRQSFVQLQKSQLEAAARLDMELDYSLDEFDSLCTLLKPKSDNFVPSEQWNALNEWVLNKSLDLIRPKIIKSRAMTTSFFDSLAEYVDEGRDIDAERFAYFLGTLSKARVWVESDESLFHTLKGHVKTSLDEIAKLCNLRYFSCCR